MRRRVRVHQDELRSRQVPRSLSAIGEPNGEPTASAEADSSSLLSLIRSRPATGPSPRALPGRGGASRGYRFRGRAGRSAATAPNQPCRPGRSLRQDTSFPREYGPEAGHVAQVPTRIGSGTSQSLLLLDVANGANGAQPTTCKQSAGNTCITPNRRSRSVGCKRHGLVPISTIRRPARNGGWLGGPAVAGRWRQRDDEASAGRRRRQDERDGGHRRG